MREKSTNFFCFFKRNRERLKLLVLRELKIRGKGRKILGLRIMNDQLSAINKFSCFWGFFFVCLKWVECRWFCLKEVEVYLYYL